MPCYKQSNLPSGVTTTGRTGYATEAECLQACQEGACCEGTTCTVKPQCQCQGVGKTFKGVGTTCSPNPCTFACSPTCSAPSEVFLTLSITNPRTDSWWTLNDQDVPQLVRDAVAEVPALFGGQYVLRHGLSWGNIAGSPQPVYTQYWYDGPQGLIGFAWSCVHPMTRFSEAFPDPMRGIVYVFRRYGGWQGTYPTLPTGVSVEANLSQSNIRTAFAGIGMSSQSIEDSCGGAALSGSGTTTTFQITVSGWSGANRVIAFDCTASVELP